MYFTDDELRCPCCGIVKMDSSFLDLLIKMRKKWGKPMYVTSAFRCKKHNAKLGSKPTSQHVLGKAVDIRVSDADRFDFIKLAFKSGFTGIGVDSRFIHLDSREKAAYFWIY